MCIINLFKESQKVAEKPVEATSETPKEKCALLAASSESESEQECIYIY